MILLFLQKKLVLVYQPNNVIFEALNDVKVKAIGLADRLAEEQRVELIKFFLKVFVITDILSLFLSL